MALDYQQLTKQCIGTCANQNVFVNINNRFISLTGFLESVRKLAEENRSEIFTKILSTLVKIVHALQDISALPASILSRQEHEIIKDAMRNYTGTFELYFLISNRDDPTAPRYVLTTSEFQEFYLKKSTRAQTVEQKSRYDYIYNQIAIVASHTAVLTGALFQASKELKYAKLEGPIRRLTAEERVLRGYDLTVEQRIQKNVEFLRGKFKQLPELEERFAEMTIGRYFQVPGMWQSHCVLAVDTLTGMIFSPKEIERRASFLSASYQQQEENAVTLDYAYGQPLADKPQIIALPTGYSVFPLELYINEKELSAEAKEVIKKTKLELFTPVLADLDKARKRTMDPKLIQKLLQLRKDLGY